MAGGKEMTAGVASSSITLLGGDSAGAVDLRDGTG